MRTTLADRTSDAPEDFPWPLTFLLGFTFVGLQAMDITSLHRLDAARHRYLRLDLFHAHGFHGLHVTLGASC